jgi:hypothetical protein
MDFQYIAGLHNLAARESIITGAFDMMSKKMLGISGVGHSPQ